MESPVRKRKIVEISSHENMFTSMNNVQILNINGFLLESHVENNVTILNGLREFISLFTTYTNKSDYVFSNVSSAILNGMKTLFVSLINSKNDEIFKLTIINKNRDLLKILYKDNDPRYKYRRGFTSENKILLYIKSEKRFTS